MTTKKPAVNKNTFEFNVVAQAQQLGARPGVRKNDMAFNEVELKTVADLYQRVCDLAATFKIGASVLNPKDRPTYLNLERNWAFYDCEDLAVVSQEYTSYSSYYVRAYLELVGIAVATADAFLGLMEPPVSLEHAPNMQVRGTDGKGKNVTWISQVKNAGEAYHHARMEYISQAFLKALDKSPKDFLNEGQLLTEVHGVIVATTALMAQAMAVSNIYSTKKWVVCKD